MGLSRHSLLTVLHFCENCRKETRFVPVHYALALTGKSRATLYYWMKRSWIHWLEEPSGRRLICEQALLLKSARPTQSLHTKLDRIRQNRTLSD
jgi:predicted DNA-binding transcriptional regulator AlpA